MLAVLHWLCAREPIYHRSCVLLYFSLLTTLRINLLLRLETSFCRQAGQIVLYSSYYGEPIIIQSQASYENHVFLAPIHIITKNTTPTKLHYECRSFERFWNAIETKKFTKAKVFGFYRTFEDDVKALAHK